MKSNDEFHEVMKDETECKILIDFDDDKVEKT